MISSEVQRTLVKSPPELWAELSDPGSLARHLGDLGEIRITRVDPEQLVEWKTEDKTGKVQIKPSGWGTRVTLSVEGEIPQAGTPLAPAHVRAPENAGDTGSEDDCKLEAETMPDAEEPPSAQAGESASDAPAPPPLPEEPEPARELEGDPAWKAKSEHQFAPATTAALASRRPAAGIETQAADEAEHAAEGEVGPTAEAETVPAEPHAWLAEEDPRPRGFFARLFGRRRGPRAQDPEPSEAIGPIEWVGLRAEPASDAQAPLAAEAPEDPPAPVPAEAGVDAADPGTEAAGASVEATGAEEETPEVPVETPKTLLGPVAPETLADGGGEAPIAQGQETPRPAPATEQPRDISADVKAAEETAAAEVTAVLTSVLDRLGAAHHRPFSRS
jgi:hypothetical protein